DPEEQDVVSRFHVARRIEAGELRGAIGPAERRERPEPARKPGIEHVRVLAQAIGAALVAGLGRLAAHVDLAAALAVVRGDLVPPPELARDTPVLDVREPVLV